MNRAEALARLGLDADSTAEEIERAWRAAMKHVHPDTGARPDGELAVLLNQAKAEALAALPKPTTDLVTLEAIAELVRAQQQAAVAGATASDRAMKQVVIHHVGGLALRRRQRATLAAASAGIAAILAVIGALVKATPNSLDVYKPILFFLGAMFGVLSAALGVMAWRVSTAERALQLELDDVGETLSDRGAVADTLTELELGDFFTRVQLREAIDTWQIDETLIGPRYPRSPLVGTVYRSVPLSHTAHTIGPVDFGKLLLTKAVELGLLVDDQNVDAEGKRQYGFRRLY